MKSKDIYLPIGLVIAIGISLIIPSLGINLKGYGINKILVMIIFFINGYKTRLKDFNYNASFFKTLCAITVISLFIGPLLGLAATILLPVTSGIALGIIIISSVPTTLSSGIVITENAGGNKATALLITIFLNFIGIFTLPLMLYLCLSVSNISLSAGNLLIKLIIIVFLPFICGNLIHKYIDIKKTTIIDYTPSTCIILIVWISASSSQKQVSQLSLKSLFLIVLASISIHLLLMLINNIAAKLLKTPYKNKIAMLFVGSQKTLPVSMSVLAALSNPPTTALIVCIIFHFLQLIIDSTLAFKIKARKNTNAKII
ncbi:MAG: bile acid:sodium symporter [Verrucomicrobiota bacterium]|nr:bile acid:sodium symporter [Verrucomicrobiota bacterium]